MDRFTRKRILLGKIQTAVGVDSVPVAAANAILVYDLSVKPLVAEKKDRKPIRPYFGNKPSLLANQHAEISFKVDFSGSGAAGTVPVWGPLVRASACAELVTAATKVEYTPIVDSMEAMTFYYHRDGALHKLLDCKGECTLRVINNDWPVLDFRFIGKIGGRVATPNPASPSFVSWIDPLIVNDTNTGDITLGGTTYVSKGLEFSFGNQLNFKALLGKENVRISDRVPTGKISLELSAADELSFLDDIGVSATKTLSLVHGTSAGNIVEISAPAVQVLDPGEEDDNGDMMSGYSLQFTPSAGNDEFKITAR